MAKVLKASKTKGQLRRVPAQARSRRRFEAILDAAAEVFAEVGFDAATMDGIATRADTSIGSVYQFFPDKLAVFRALAQRNIDRSRVVFEQFISVEGARRPWPELIDQAIDAFWEIQASDPGVRALLANLQLYGVYEEEDAAVTREFVDRVEAAMRPYAPALDAPTRRLVATMLVQTTSSLLFVAARVKPPLSTKMVEETKKMLRSYLSLYAGS